MPEPDNSCNRPLSFEKRLARALQPKPLGGLLAFYRLAATTTPRIPRQPPT